MTTSATVLQFVTGLRSKNEETRARAARELRLHVSTELKEATGDELMAFMEEFNHHIFEMVTSPETSDKKGGLLAIGQLSLFGFSYYCKQILW